MNEPPGPVAGSGARRAARPRAADRALRRGRRVGDRRRARPHQLRHERVRGPGARGHERAGCGSRTSAPAATTPRPGSTRWTATASTPRCCTRRRGCRPAIIANRDAGVPPRDGAGLQRLDLRVRRARARALRRPGDPAQPRRRERARRRDRPRPRPARDARRRDGLLPERHALDRARRRQGVGRARRARRPARHPRVADAADARRAPRAAARATAASSTRRTA